MVNGRYYAAEIKLPVQPALNADMALERVMADIGKRPDRGKSASELVIYPLDGAFYLAWQVHFSDPVTHASRTYVIDAQNGRVLRKSDDTDRADGTGNIFECFPPMPPADPGLNLSTVTLPRLDGTGFVRGLYADVDNAGDARLDSLNLNFTAVNPASVHFDEVNVYYHIDQFRHDFINPLGFEQQADSLYFGQIKAYTNDGVQGAEFVRSERSLKFGATNGISWAREAQIIYHEYMHAVVYVINKMNEGNHIETKALNEALPDYFAGAFVDQKNSPIDNAAIIGEYAFPATQRDMNNPVVANYSDFQSKPDQYEGAEFFSGILWSLRPQIGADTTNQIVFNTLYNVTYTVNFLGFREAMINLAGQANKNTIQNVFAEKGIGAYAYQPPNPPANLQISGTISGHPTLSWTPPECPDLSHFRVYRKGLSDPDFICIGLTPGGSLTDTEVIISGDFLSDDIRYYVKAVNNWNQVSDPSNEVRVWYAYAYPGMSGQESVMPVFYQEIMPEIFAMHANYPNPFNTSTVIRFDLPAASHVELSVYNLAGREIARLKEGNMTPGIHTVHFDGTDLPSGVYIARLKMGKEVFSRRMLLLK